MRWVGLTILVVALIVAAIWVRDWPSPPEAVPAAGLPAGASEVAVGEHSAPLHQEAPVARAVEDRVVPSREVVERPAHRGTLIDSTGSPVANARVSWASIPSLIAEASPDWDEVDWTVVEQHTVWTDSDVNGNFTFLELPPAASNHGSVIWVTHPDHMATSIIFSDPDVDLPAESRVVMQEAPARRAHVVNESGEPAEGAAVRQFAIANSDDDPQVAAARRVFYRESQTDGTGVASLSTFQGREALYALRAREVSEPLVRDCSGDVTLRLSPSFLATGLVALPTAVPEGEQVRVSYSTRNADRWDELGRCLVAPDGSWGPATIPLLTTDTYRFSVTGGGVVRQDREIAPPVAGETVRIDFDSTLGLDQWFYIVDGATDGVLLDASVEVRWQEDDSSWTSIEARPRDDGYILARGCRSGSIRYEARAPGYSSYQSEPIVIPMPEPLTFKVELFRAGRVTGRCEFAGKPVLNFAVLYWPGSDIYDRKNEHFRDSEDGIFVLESVPEGELSLVAHADGYGQSEVVMTTVAPGETTDIVLELSRALLGRGVVIDQLTDNPIESAAIQLYAGQGSQPIHATGATAYSDSEGQFELAGLSAISSTFRVAAAGYSDSYVTTSGKEGTTIDLGVVAMAPSQPFEIRLLYSDGVDPTQYSVRTKLSGLPPTVFSREGVVRVDAFAAGANTLVVEMPGRELFHVPINLIPGYDWYVEVPLDGSCRLDVEVSPEQGSELPSQLWAFVKLDGDRGSMDRGRGIPESGQLTFEHLPPGPFDVKITDDTYMLAGVSGNLAEGEATAVHITLGDVYRFRVVDDGGKPLPSTFVQFSVDGSERAEFGGTSDAAGEFLCGGLSGSVTAHLENPVLGWATHVPVQLPADASEVIELELAAHEHWHAILRDGAVPVSGVSCRLLARNSALAVGHDTSDAEGHISWEPLNRGDYDFFADHPNYWPTSATLGTTEETPHVIQVRRRGDLRVTVRTAGGVKAPGASVRIVSDEFETDVTQWVQSGLVSASPASLTTDEDGELVLEGLPHGEYRWTVEHPASNAVSGSATVPRGQLASLTATLP